MIAGAIRVLVVDDSAIVRGLVLRWLEAEAGIEVAGVAFNGLEAVKLAGATRPDVIVLDVEMPEMDGLEAIPKIIAAAPGARILMASTLTHRNAEITLKALSLGATDYVPKPESGRISGAADFKRDLIARIRALGQVRQAATPMAARSTPAARPIAAPRGGIPQVLVVGSSTGGPQALNQLCSVIGGKLPAPILIAQHMPAMFTTILAEHLAKASGAPACEAKDGMPLKAGSIYLAPGDHHMRVVRRQGAVVATLDKSPPVNFCRPAVDPLFMSAGDVYGAGTLAVVLTGMGQDGKNGAQGIVARGGSVIAQDEATSVVWGMPGAVARAGFAMAVRPLGEIGPTVLNLFQGK